MFMIGGTTYEEARAVSLFNQDNTAAASGSMPTGTRLLLGGTCVHNSSTWVITLYSPYRAPHSRIPSFLEMIRSSAASFPPSIFEAPPEQASNAPALNLNLGGVNVSLGGPAGTGVYRSSGDGVGVQADGIRDGVRNLFGKVKQGVDRIGIQ